MNFTLALGIPNTPNVQDPRNIEQVSTESLFSGILSDISGSAVIFFDLVATFLVIAFMFGIIFMLLSFLMKNGQWQKFAQGTMMGSFFALLVIRGYPILVYSVQNSEEFASFFEQTAIVLSYTSLFIGLISIAVSFLFKFGHRLIEHQDFYRWSKNLFGVAVVMMIFSVVVPIVFPLI